MCETLGKMCLKYVEPQTLILTDVVHILIPEVTKSFPNALLSAEALLYTFSESWTEIQSEFYYFSV